MQRTAAHRGPSTPAIQQLLMFVVVWTAVLPTLIAAYAPASASLLPGHTHATLSGFIPDHHHDNLTADQRGCVADGPTMEAVEVACGADGTVAVGALLPGLSPVGVIAAAGLLVTSFESLVDPSAAAHILGTPPPRD